MCPPGVSSGSVGSTNVPPPAAGPPAAPPADSVSPSDQQDKHGY